MYKPERLPHTSTCEHFFYQYHVLCFKRQVTGAQNMSLPCLKCPPLKSSHLVYCLLFWWAFVETRLISPDNRRRILRAELCLILYDSTTNMGTVIHGLRNNWELWKYLFNECNMVVWSSSIWNLSMVLSLTTSAVWPGGCYLSSTSLSSCICET